jgi:hypothetical protein
MSAAPVISIGMSFLPEASLCYVVLFHSGFFFRCVSKAPVAYVQFINARIVINLLFPSVPPLVHC